MRRMLTPSRRLLVAALMLTLTTVASADDLVAASDLSAAIAAGKPPLIIDVRSPEEYRAGHVPGAVLLPVQAFPQAIERLPPDRDRPIVVYCEMGPRAGLARMALRMSGYTRVSTLEGHMRAWRENGLTMEITTRDIKM